MQPLSNLTTRPFLTSVSHSPRSSLVSLPLEVREEVENYLRPVDRQHLLSALTMVTLKGESIDSPALKLHLLQERIAPKDQWTLAHADESLHAFALNQLQKLSEAGQLDQVVEKPALCALLDLVGNPTIYGFLREKIQQAPHVKQKLLNWVERSKTEEVQTIAANALTILVKSGVQFNGADLKGIRVPGADLSGGIFDSAQLQGADLTGAKLHASWLRQANLTGAQMAGVRFGEGPYLQGRDHVRCRAYSPDGKTCVIGHDSELSVYATANWEKIHTLNVKYDNRSIWSVAYSPNGNQIVSGSSHGIVRVWNAHTGEIGLFLDTHTTDYITNLAYSPDGAQIVSGGNGKTVRVWDAHTGVALHTLNGHSKEVLSVVYSPRGDQIASGSKDNTVRVWDAYTGEALHTLRGHNSFVFSVVNSVAYSPNGDQIVSGGSDEMVRVWDTRTGEALHTLRGHSSFVYSVAYSPNGTQIVSGSGSGTVHVWDAHTGDLLHTLRDYTQGRHSVAYSSDGEQIISSNEVGTVRILNANTNDVRYLSGHSEYVRSAAYLLGSEQIFSEIHNHKGRNAYIPDLNGHFCVAYSPKGEQMVSGSRDNTVLVWDAHAGNVLHTLRGHTQNIRSLAYSPEGKQIASGSDDYTVRVWDAYTGEALQILHGYNAPDSVVYSPSGDQIAAGGFKKTAHVWNPQTGEALHVLSGHTENFDHVVYSPSGDWIASGGHDATVRLWDAHTGKALHILKGHTKLILSIAFSPDGDQIASCSEDQTVRIWDVASGQCLVVVRDFHKKITRVVWEQTPEGAYLVTVNTDKSLIRQWHIKKEGEVYKAILRWSSGHEALIATGTLLDGVRGLDQVNYALLKQRGAVGEPSASSHETSQQRIAESRSTQTIQVRELG